MKTPPHSSSHVAAHAVHHHQHHHHNHHKSNKGRSSSTKTTNIIMTELAAVSGDHQHNETMEYKYILLEDLGTASSWLILLLPYIAFLLSILLEYATPLSTSTIGPISVMNNNNHTNTCSTTDPITINNTYSLPVTYLSSSESIGPCHSSFRFTETTYENSDKNRKLLSSTSSTTTTNGTMFDTGILDRMPIIGTYLSGDVTFSHISSDALSFIAQGQLQSSVLVMEEEEEEEDQHDNSRWKLLFVSERKTISMTCVYHGKVQYGWIPM